MFEKETIEQRYCDSRGSYLKCAAPLEALISTLLELIEV